MQLFEFVVMGAGFAGAATAYQLTRRGAGSVALIERESIPGFHASGRNAAMLRQCVPEAHLAKLTREGADFIRNLPGDWPEPVSFKPHGSLLLGAGEAWKRLRRDAETGRSLGIDVTEWTPEETRRHVPVLKGAQFEGAIWCATDGIVDIHALLSGYLRAAAARGATIRYNVQVRSIRAASRGFEIETDGETLHAGTLINAAGAWANSVADMAGARAMPLRPCRRHLFVTPPMDRIDPTWPFVWDVAHDIYFRPEGAGLLLCACDQDEMAPCDPPVEEAVKELLAEKIDRYMPALAGVRIARGWAGFRTLTADGSFIIGRDPELKNFFWVAGLGGHGMTTSAAVGALAADLLAGAPGAAPFSPQRFRP